MFIVMKKYLSICCALLFSTTLMANEIAIINMENIVKESVAFKRLNDSLEKEKNTYQEKIKQKEIELNAKRDDLQSKASLLSQETLQQKSLEFQKEILTFQEEVKNKESELQSKLVDGLNILNNEVKIIVEELIKEKEFSKYNAVANSAMFIHYNTKDDLTLEVLKRLNKKNISLIKKGK